MQTGLQLRKKMLNTLLSAPSPMLRMMSGGSSAYRGGRTLDPRLQFLAAMSRWRPAAEADTPALARAYVVDILKSIKPRLEPGVTTSAYQIDGPRGPIPCRVYRPAHQDPSVPVMVYAHCGGGVVGDLETSDVFCSILAKIASAPVLSVDYRLAPEHKFPAGLEDVLAAFRHAREHAADFGAPKGMAAIGGDSAGGNFAAVICQILRDAGEPQPSLQLLIYPAVDLSTPTRSMTTYGDAYPMTLAAMKWFACHYLGPADDPADPRISPLRAETLKGLAPAIVVTAGFDPVVDQGEAYARRLRDCGVPTLYRCYDSLIHCFTAYTGVAPAADVACREIAGLVREGYCGRIRCETPRGR